MLWPPFNHASRAGALPAWLQRPLLQPAPRAARVHLHALFLGLIAASSLLVHPYLGIALTPSQLAVHSLLVLAGSAFSLLLAELAAMAWSRAHGGDGTVTTAGFFLRAVAGYLGSAALIGSLHRPWAYTRAILEAHEVVGGSAVATTMAPLAALLTYLVYQYVRNEALARDLAALQSLNDRLRTAPLVATEGRPLREPAITVPCNGVEIGLPVSSIAQVRADENYCHVTTRAWNGQPVRSYLVRMTLAEAIRLLPPGQFVQTHRSHVVNLECVANIVRDGSRRELTLHGGESIPVSRARMPQVRERLAQLLGSTVRAGEANRGTSI